MRTPARNAADGRSRARPLAALALLGAFLVAGLCARPAAAWQEREHLLLGEQAWGAALAGCEATLDSLPPEAERQTWKDPHLALAGGRSFAGLCAWLARHDRRPDRFLARGRTVYESLWGLDSARVEGSWRLRHGWLDAVRSGHDPATTDHDVAAAWLLHHLMALRLARQAGVAGGAEQRTLEDALAFEAAAQGYLADAFSAPHLLPPPRGPLVLLESANQQQAHAARSAAGAFVINGRGDAWQTFGDRLLGWYAPSDEHVLEACASSLRELFVVWLVSRGQALPDTLGKWWEASGGQGALARAVPAWTATLNGREACARDGLPTVRLLPVPVRATWSLRGPAADAGSASARRHLPQVREPGGHDPGLMRGEVARLPLRAAFPEWMRPDALVSGDPARVLREDANVASVLFVPDRDPGPSFVGTVARVGVGFERGPGSGSGMVAGLGWGFIDERLGLANVSVETLFSPRQGSEDRTLIAPAFGFGVVLPGVNRLHSTGRLRLEGGYAWGLGSGPRAHGPLFGVGLESPVLPLGFTFAGVAARAMYRWTWLERTVPGVTLELVFQ